MLLVELLLLAIILRTKVKRVSVNDFLKFNFHIGKALIENKNITLDDDDIALLLSKKQKSGSLIEDIFTDVFFERDQAHFLDNFQGKHQFVG